ncbi:MAG: hypothetical protein ACI3XJ_12725 [Oscillospiraceae bacterium]
MPTTKDLNALVINTVETQDVYDYMVSHGMTNSDELYLVQGTTTVPSKTSDLENDSGFLTEESDPTVPAWAKESTKPTYTADEVGALPDTTTIPSALSDLSDDATHRTVTDAEKTAWSGKHTVVMSATQPAGLGSGDDWDKIQ